MKKIVTVFITLAILCTGCTKESLTPERNEVEVSFVFNNIAETGNIQTRAFSDNFSSWQYKNPSTVYLLSCNTGKTYTLDFTKSRTFNVEPGSYFAYSRKGNPRTLNRNFYANNASEVPLEIHDLGLCSLENSEETLGYVLNIQGSGEYTLEVRHSAIVLACKKEDVSYFRWYANGQGWNEDQLCSSSGYFYYILTVPDYLVVGGDQNKITVTVEMGGTESTETTQVSVDIVKSSRGKYFVFSPNKKGSTFFSMQNIQEWENGGVSMSMTRTNEALTTGTSDCNLWLWKSGSNGQALRFVDNGNGSYYLVTDINSTVQMLFRRYMNWDSGSKFGSASGESIVPDNIINLVENGNDLSFTGNGRYRVEIKTIWL